jgi:GntR family transcriptional regulator
LSFVSDTTDGRSLQLRIADAIRARITSGQYPPGSQLPGLPALAQTYKASLVTVRLAVARLRQEGLIMSQQGVGNFVREQPPVRRYGIGRYSRSVWGGTEPQRLLDAEGARQGRAVGQETETDRVPAPAWVADRLTGVSEGDLVHVRRRVTTIDGVVNQSADSYFAVATGERNPDLLTGRGAGGHIARISAVSPVTEVQEEITARIPTSPEAARLGIPEGTPVFDVIRTYHTAAEGALDVARFVIRADMAAFDYRFPVPD